MLVRIETPDINIFISDGRMTFQNLRLNQNIILDVELETIQIRDGHKEIVRSTIYDLMVPCEGGIKNIITNTIASVIIKLSSNDIIYKNAISENGARISNSSKRIEPAPKKYSSSLQNSQETLANEDKLIDFSQLATSDAVKLLMKMKGSGIDFPTSYPTEMMIKAANDTSNTDFAKLADDQLKRAFERRVQAMIDEGLISSPGEYPSFMMAVLRGEKSFFNNDNL